ncbi:MAG TPA: glycosyltransferase family 4 protein [Allosphingosinicella sp.]|jgi:glycosyltransferase involved in cell wall biosynthesis
MASPPTSRPAAAQRVVVFGSFPWSLINFRGPLIAELVARGHEVFALAPDIDEDVAGQVRALGAEPVSIRLGRTSLNPFGALATLKDLARTFRSIAPDVVLAYTIKPIILGAVAARAARVPRFVCLVTGLGYAFTGGREPKRLFSRAVGKRMYRRAFARASLAVFQNPDDLGEFRRLGLLPPTLRTALINGSGVDIGHFSPAPLPAGASFLLIARLLKDKGIREFGRAAARLKAERPDVRISLVGFFEPSANGIGKAEIDGLVAAGIEYLGPQSDVRPAIAAHSVYVLPSYREGTPRSVLEAMAMGRPAITTDAPGCRETVADGVNGFLVPVKDWEAVYRAMLRFVDEPGLIARMGAEARRVAEEKFDVRKVNAALLAEAGL